MIILRDGKLEIRTFAILLGMISIGCSSPDQQARDCLVGRWEWKLLTPIEGVFSGEIAFYADGRFHQTLTGGEISATIISYFVGRSFLGRWTVENGELIVSRDGKNDSKNVQIFSIGNNESGLHVKVNIDHCDKHETLFSNKEYRWICKKSSN
jgi:hypothetical protein